MRQELARALGGIIRPGLALAFCSIVAIATIQGCASAQTMPTQPTAPATAPVLAPADEAAPEPATAAPAAEPPVPGAQIAAEAAAETQAEAPAVAPALSQTETPAAAAAPPAETRMAEAAPAPQASAPPPRAQETPPDASSFRSSDYVLGVGDRIRIIVFQEPSLSGEFVVDSTGLVALPLIGEVMAAGSTVRGFEESIEQSLRNGYLNDPRVSAEVLNFRPYYILGEIARPGEYPYTSNLTVLNAVATAGGFGPLANRTRVFIKHDGDETESEVQITGATAVLPGDTIRIAKGSFYILGEVARPGEYPHSDGLTAIAAVATAGGFTVRANRRRIYIQRQGEPDEESERLTPDLLVEPGDTLRIGERFF